MFSSCRALSNLTRVSEGMLKCTELVVELESELDETTADEADHEELLKDAVRRSEEIGGCVVGGRKERDGERVRGRDKASEQSWYIIREQHEKRKKSFLCSLRA